MLGQIQEASDAIIQSGREFGIIATLFVIGLLFMGWMLWQFFNTWKVNDGVKTEAYVKAQSETATEMKESYRAHTAGVVKTNELIEQMAMSSINTSQSVDRISRAVESQVIVSASGNKVLETTLIKTDAIHRAISGLVDVALEMANGDANLMKLLRSVQEDLRK